MHIYCRQDLLLNSINTVLKACSTKTTMPILECILLTAADSKLTLVGNNLELGIESTVDADVISEGCIALEAKIFSEIIRRMPGEVIEISTDENYMTSMKSPNSRLQDSQEKTSQHYLMWIKSVHVLLSKLILKK